MSNLIPLVLIYKSLREKEKQSQSRPQKTSIRPQDRPEGYDYHLGNDEPYIVKKDVDEYEVTASDSLFVERVRQCINLIYQDEKTRDAVLKYIEKVEEVNTLQEQHLRDVFFELCSKYEEKLNILQVVEPKVLELGFRLDRLYDSFRYVKRANNENGYDFSYVRMYSLFNGVQLTRNEAYYGTNVYKSQLDNFLRGCPNIEEKLASYKQEYEKLSQRTLLLKVSAKSRKRLEDLKKSIAQYEKLSKTASDLKKSADHFASLTPEQRNIIVAYLDLKNDFAKLGKDLDEVCEYIRVTSGVAGNNKTYQEELQSRMQKAKSLLSEEDQAVIDSVSKKFAQTLLTASRQELNQLAEIDEKMAIDPSTNAIRVYESLCIQTRQYMLQTKKENSNQKIG